MNDDATPPEGFRPQAEPASFEAHCGPLYTSGADAGYACAIRADERHCNKRGAVHGGLLITLADHTLGHIVWRHVDEAACATVTLNTDFVSGAVIGDWLVCRGAVTRETRSLVFIQGEVRCGERVVMTASGIWKKLGR